MSDEDLVEHFTKIKGIQPAQSPPLRGIAVGMAGNRRESDSERIRLAVGKVWPGVPCYATSDLETALVAEESSTSASLPRVLVLSGTGSCCFGRTAEGKTVRYGGWGHILGDKGSGYDIGLRALKAVVNHFDREGKWSLLGQNLLQALVLNDPEDLIGWVKRADKSEVSALAVPVFAAAAKRDKLAAEILSVAAAHLASDAVNCACRVAEPGQPVEFVFAGSILLKQPGFARQVRAKLIHLWPRAKVTLLKRPSVFGAIELARSHFGTEEDRQTQNSNGIVIKQAEVGAAAIPAATQLSPTEQRNPRSLNLDRMPLIDAVELMINEESRISKALLARKREIEKAIGLVVKSFKNGGRLFYVGAGTSGRLAILDASECPPTFCTPPEQVQGIIAGGHTALWRSVEGAEDDALAGARAIEFRGLDKHDVVVGIAASGRTPFVWGALAEGRKRGAATILLCFNPHLQIKPENKPDLLIAIDVGPEILTGSTRLKAGTATKVVLNIVSTLSMVRIGKVTSNLMTDLNASNLKLRERAVRIVQALSGAEAAAARAALEKNKWIVKAACEQLCY